ncbi:MFS transporter [Gordonia sp. ABSL1-1]|uniref:MFS transporter n=1 Tax=Gordonia sp. ABSL1-1 TaxID=3053923 RepID=UPI002572D489|nr:MFS transporter [Gordonia sp. ABSL1-1]MDL9937708.1 MFS transporter [Gordonia sp. ABSL1-1]
MSFGLFMVGLDSTVVHIANPAIQADLGASFAELQWIINSYLLALAVLLILGGKLGDRFGRKKIYLGGVALFGLTSIGIGVVGSIEGVIALRALQGVSAALLMPQTIALLRATFPREKFGMAVGIWGGVSSVAIAAGPLVSGVLVEQYSWPWVFYINAPIALIALIYGQVVITETQPIKAGRFDVVGVLLLGAFLFALVFGVVQGQSWGWGSAKTIGTFVAAAVALAIFVLAENRIRNPLLPLYLFRSTGVSVGGVVFVANVFTILGLTFLVTLFLLNTLGYSTIEAGIRMLPLSAFSIPAAPLGAALTARFGPRRIAALGLTLMGVALVLLTQVEPGSSYWLLAVPFVILAFGSGFAIPSGADLIVGGAPVHLAGVASGFQTTCIQVGGAIGTAVLSAIVAARIGTATDGLDLPPGTEEAAAAGVPLDGVPQVNDAFISGMHIGMLVAATLAFVSAALTLLAIRDGRRHDVATVLAETAEGEAGHR